MARKGGDFIRILLAEDEKRISSFDGDKVIGNGYTLYVNEEAVL